MKLIISDIAGTPRISSADYLDAMPGAGWAEVGCWWREARVVRARRKGGTEMKAMVHDKR